MLDLALFFIEKYGVLRYGLKSDAGITFFGSKEKFIACGKNKITNFNAITTKKGNIITF